MRIEVGRTHSPQESRRGLTPSPAWDQAIVLSNRGPVSQDRGTDGTLRSRRSSGGLVTAIEPLVQAFDATWVACGAQDLEGGVESRNFDVRSATSRYRLRHVGVSAEEYRGYYCGFANEGLWPLCHSVGVQPMFRHSDFLAYHSVNRRFAAAVVEEASCAAPLLLVQDYHCALAPRELRYRLPAATVVAFWHIPWPPFHVLRACPWARAMVDGLLASDIVGFQTPADGTNFVNAAERILGAKVDRSSGAVSYRGRQTRVAAYPVGVEWNNDVVRATPPAAECRAHLRRELGLPPDVMLGVGVDRLDYTKGINHKFLAIERLLEQHPELRRRFVFVQVAEPSRDDLPAYRSARAQLVATAQRVNERFGDGSSTPIRLRETHHTPHDVYRLYRAADLCHVGSLRDGMNLVAKEFVCARDDERGVLVLSECAGAALQLREALLINPWSVDSSSQAMWNALTMIESEQVARMRLLRHGVASEDAGQWARRLLADAESMRPPLGTEDSPHTPPVQLSA